MSGDIFLHRLVEILPRFSSKRQVVEISQQIESDISAYLVTITIMNAAVGIAMALAMWLTGVGDPILWGTVAFLLNYVPILGTALGVLIFLLAGLLTIDPLWQALLPAGLYLGFHLIEGETRGWIAATSSACGARLRNSPRNWLTLQAQALHSGTP